MNEITEWYARNLFTGAVLKMNLVARITIGEKKKIHIFFIFHRRGYDEEDHTNEICRVI